MPTSYACQYELKNPPAEFVQDYNTCLTNLQIKNPPTEFRFPSEDVYVFSYKFICVICLPGSSAASAAFEAERTAFLRRPHP